MHNIAIFPIVNESGAPAFRAVSNTSQSEGRTAGEALDAIAPNVPSDSSGTLVLIQPFHADRFFTATQQDRLEALMSRWRAARDGGPALSNTAGQELKELAAAELQAATERAGQILREIGG